MEGGGILPNCFIDALHIFLSPSPPLPPSRGKPRQNLLIIDFGWAYLTVWFYKFNRLDWGAQNQSKISYKMKYKFGGDPSGQDGLAFPSYLKIDLVVTLFCSLMQLHSCLWIFAAGNLRSFTLEPWCNACESLFSEGKYLFTSCFFFYPPGWKN